VRIGHGRWRRSVSLLALGALSEAERGPVVAHLEGCVSCREELAGIRAALAVLDDDPVRKTAPPITAGALLARVEARLAEPGPAGFGLRPVPALLSAAALALAVGVWLRLPHGPTTATGPGTPERTTAESRAASSGSEELLRRMDRQLSREQAVRYLSDAQDVLATLAAAPQRCRRAGRIDVGEEARRSRELLARRALLVDLQGEEVASARPVLEDVEHVLREVASLGSCARQRDLDSLHREIERRRLLMKIDLMTRELEG
jgi:putative zinc finger protein